MEFMERLLLAGPISRSRSVKVLVSIKHVCKCIRCSYQPRSGGYENERSQRGKNRGEHDKQKYCDRIEHHFHKQRTPSPGGGAFKNLSAENGNFMHLAAEEEQPRATEKRFPSVFANVATSVCVHKTYTD